MTVTDWETKWVQHQEGLYILLKVRLEDSLDGMPRPYSQICAYVQLMQEHKVPLWRVMVPTQTGNVKELEPTIHFWDVDDAMHYLEQVA